MGFVDWDRVERIGQNHRKMINDPNYRPNCPNSNEPDSVGFSTFKGACIGGMVGSCIPVVGTAVGAVIGGIGGLFAGVHGNKPNKK